MSGVEAEVGLGLFSVEQPVREVSTTIEKMIWEGSIFKTQ